MNKAHRGNATTRPRIHVFLSDEAFEFLIQQAVDYQYVSNTRNQHKHGFSDYIEALSRCTFRDTRPQDVRESDLPRLESGRLPWWSMEGQRRARYVAMTVETQARLRTIALDVGITNTNRPDSVDLPRSPISAMLEAVGNGWLTPTNMTVNPNPPKSIINRLGASHKPHLYQRP